MTSPLGVCRWMLDCAQPATAEVVVKSLDITTVACDEHAKDHQDWASDTRVRLTPHDEPEPECYCPDEWVSNGTPAHYCPSHGTPAQRGIDPLAEDS